MKTPVSKLEKFTNDNARVDTAAVQPLPNSRKIYIQGSRADIRVPMREITQSDTTTGQGIEKNPSICVYDTSGPYTDPDAHIDIRRGLPALREKWIDERADTGILAGLSSTYSLKRLQDPSLTEMRFNLTRPVRRAKTGDRKSVV